MANQPEDRESGIAESFAQRGCFWLFLIALAIAALIKFVFLMP